MDSMAQLFLKKGLGDTGISVISFDNIIRFGVLSLSSWLVWLGILIYIINFILWLVIIYRIDLSIAMPVGSVAYALVPILAVIFLHEHISPIRWLGIAMILLGIYFTSQSKKETAQYVYSD